MRKMMITTAMAVAVAAALSFGAMASEDTKVEAGGLVFDIPAEFKDLVTVETEGLEPGELIRVSETASIEAAEAMGEDTCPAARCSQRMRTCTICSITRRMYAWKESRLKKWMRRWISGVL